MNADSVLIRRLTTYWKIEAGNVVFVPSIAIYLVLSSGGTISAALVLSCLACSFLLVIGTMALRMMLRKARGDAGATKTRIPLLRGLRWPALALCVATAVALGAFPEETGLDEDDVLVLVGDVPLLRADTVAALVAHHRDSDAAATLLTTHVDDPTGYGRIVRDARGGVARIV